MKYDFKLLFAKFIASSRSGKHKQLNGNKLRSAVVLNYGHFLRSITQFTEATSTSMYLYDLKKVGKNVIKAEIKKWFKISTLFSKYLYSRGCHDNYVNSHFKIIKVFLRYLSNEKLIDCMLLLKCFKSVKEQIPVIVLDQDHLAFLTANENFEKSLPQRLKLTKDIFVVGCFVGLRYGDLMSLRPINIQTKQGRQYLKVKSIKTNSETVLKLPNYILSIFNKYKRTGKLLPQISNSQLNKNIKLLCERAGWTNEVGKTRSQEGIQKIILKNGKPYRFCDIVTTHTMRRTAITNLLLLGVPELMVRQISGHSAGSKAFYKYVNFAQQYMDTAIDQAYLKMDAIIEQQKN